MRERIYRTDGLILRRNDFGEADRLLVMATPGGKRRVIVKGARKTSSRLAGHVELFTHARMLVAIGRNLDIVTQSQVVDGFDTLRGDLCRLSMAYYAAELYDKLVQEEEENLSIFRLLIQTFTALNLSINPDLVLRAYEMRLLHNAGYRPHLHRCAVCQEILTEDAHWFSATLGGVVSRECAASDRHAQPMSLNAFKLLRYLQSQPFTAIERLNISSAVRMETERLLRVYLRHILERDLKSVAFLDSVQYGDTTGFS